MVNYPELEDDEFSFAVWSKDGSDVDARSFRALTPSQAAERRAYEDFDGRRDCRDWRDDYCVRNNGTGKLYVVRVGLVPQPSFVAIDVRDVPMEPMEPATHVLWGGRALCADLRLRGVPGEWPDGQRWISLRDVAAGPLPTAPPDPCEACWTKAPGFVDELIGSAR